MNNKLNNAGASAPASNTTKQKKKRNYYKKPTIKKQPDTMSAAESPKTTAPKTRSKKAIKSKTNTANAPKKNIMQTTKQKAQKKSASKQSKRTGVGNNRNKVASKTPLRIIPLGGLNEIGKNITLYEYGDDMLIVDCGLAFPDSEMLGVDLVIPDFTYVEKNKEKLRGIVLTHGHEDHIGGLAYLLKKVNVPVYGTRLTLGLVEGKLKEHGILHECKLHEVMPRQSIKLGVFEIEFIHVNHSIPGAIAMGIHTPVGTVVQTGDFKIDYTPIESAPIDLARFAQLGDEGVLCLLSDSTNAERPGITMSERKVGQSFERLFAQAQGKRIIIASFASNIHRIQQIVDCAKQWGRKVAVSGRSMVNVVAISRELGYLSAPDDVFIDIDEVSRYPHEKIVIVTTGSQGEPMSALSRMASNDHRKVNVGAQDFIIISATPIPGNEKHVTRVVNELLKLGCEVIYESMYEVHVSGHACQEELKLMLSLTRPKYFMPVHGEYKHLKKHAELAIATGLDEQNVHIGDIGQVIEFNGVNMRMAGLVPSGRVFVDGLGVGDVGSVVLRDRKHLGQDGIVIVVAAIDPHTGDVVSGPDVVTRGFVYVRESEELIEGARHIIKNTFQKCVDKNVREWGQIKNAIRDELSDHIFKKTRRSPMILPILMDIHS